MIDGDGWVNSCLLGLCGTNEIVSGFHQFISSYLGWEPGVVPYQKTECCWEIKYAGAYTKQLLAILYHDSMISLTRKFLIVAGV
jgi:hypothetical protein